MTTTHTVRSSRFHRNVSPTRGTSSKLLRTFWVLFFALAGISCNWSGKIVDPDSDFRSVTRLERACDKRDFSACLTLSARHRHGQGVPQSFEKMEAYQRRACDLGSAQGCGLLASTYRIGYPGLEQDVARAHQLDMIACDKGFGGSCYALAGWDYTGEIPAANDKPAEYYLDKACRAGWEMACHAQGREMFGSISIATLHAAVRESPGLDRCLLTGSKPSEGAITLRFEVDMSGKAREMEILDTTVAPGLETCIADHVKAVTFPRSFGGPAEVYYIMLLGADGSLVHLTPAATRMIPFMERALKAPHPDLEALADTKTARARQAGSTRVYFCIDESGVIVDSRVAQRYPGGPAIDQLLLDTIRRWKFVPFLIDGTPTKVCGVYTFTVEFS